MRAAMGITVFQYEFVVTAIAKCTFCTMFTTTEVNSLGLLGSKCNGRKRSCFVATITKRLILTQTTRTPVIGLPGSDFSGKATQRAKLRFTPEKARWVASETWHGQQISSFDKDGNYILEFDYNQDPELVMEIMKHGSGVEVIAPVSLKNRVKAELQKTLSKY